MIIEIDNISKSYGNQKVIENFSLQIESEHSYVITGESGSGKTTLLRILLGLETADEGRISLLGDYKYPYLNAGVVFQEDRLLEGFSAVENVAMASRRMAKETAREELEKLLPADQLDKPVRELSGGMKRRVAIVRACSISSDILILDEPFTGLDDGNKEKVIQYIRQKQGNNPLVITSHSLEGLEFCRNISIK